MPSARSLHAPRRGLLAGLVALTVFASGAVSMTAHGASGTAAPAAPVASVTPAATGTAVTFDDGGGRGDRRGGGR